MPWYALQVRSCAEAVVEAAARATRTESFFPSENVKRTRGEIWRRPFFPGYVFAQFDFADRQPLIRIPQVLRIVSAGIDPLPIPDCQIEAVRRVAEFAEELRVKALPVKAFSEGQKVLVKSGPLRGIEGYVAYEKSATRLVVSVEFLGQAVSAEVDATWLAAA